MAVNDLIRQALILDVETTSLTRGAGIHQLATYSVGGEHLTQWFLNPNLTQTEPGLKGQDVTRLASSAYDKHRAHLGLGRLGDRATWHDVTLAQLLMDRSGKEELVKRLKLRGVRNVTGLIEAAELDMKGIARIPGVWNDVVATLQVTDPFQYDQIVSGNFHYLSGNLQKSDAELRTLLRSKGSAVQRVKSLTSAIDDVLMRGDSPLIDQFRRHAIWIANADFESKQLGAKIAVYEQSVWDEAAAKNLSEVDRAKKLYSHTALRRVINGTSATTSDMFYVTGKEVNRARMQARITGDWRGVFSAYMAQTGPGDVRDIIDVVRAQQTYGQKLGLLTGTRPFSLGMDVQARLYGFAAATSTEGAKRALLQREAHIAAFDTSLSEDLVFRKSLRQTEALQQWTAGGARAKELETLAAQGKGPLYEALRYFTALEHLAPQLQEQALTQRFGRMFQDFATAGETSQLKGYEPISRSIITREGRLDKISGPRAIRQTYTDMGEAVEFILRQDIYGRAEGRKVYENVLDRLVGEGAIEANVKNVGGGGIRIKSAERLAVSSKMLAETAGRQLDAIFSREADSLLLSSVKGVRKGLHLEVAQGLRPSGVDRKLFGRSAGKMFGMFSLGMAGLNLFDAVRTGPRRQREGPESLRTINYQQWLENQGKMYGLNAEYMNGMNKPQFSGMLQGGLAGVFRQAYTDFGSPYKGPQITHSVFTQQNMLEEREKFMQNQFARIHMSPQGEIGRLLTAWVTLPMSYAQDMLNKNQGKAHPYRASGKNYSFFPGPFDTVNGAQYAGLRPANFLKLNLSEGGWKVSATDADTIVVSRQRASKGWFDFFGGTESYSFRIAGIDAPETTKGAKQGQPWANAATVAAKQMIENSRNLEILIDPSNITYGRMVGSLFADHKNVGLELVRQGMAQFLPYKGKGTKQMYQYSSYQAAENMAIDASKGIWNTPYFRPYGDWKKQSGQSVTFNQMVNTSRVVQNSKFMSLRAVMEHSERLGFYGASHAAEIAQLSSSANKIMGMDYDNRWREINQFEVRSAPHKAYMNQMQNDLAGLIKTRGSHTTSKFEHRNMHSLNKTLVLDSMGTTNSIFSKRSLSTFDMYNVNHYNNLRGRDPKKSKRQMADIQRNLNYNMFTHGVNHHVM